VGEGEAKLKALQQISQNQFRLRADYSRRVGTRFQCEWRGRDPSPRSPSPRRVPCWGGCQRLPALLMDASACRLLTSTFPPGTGLARGTWDRK